MTTATARPPRAPGAFTLLEQAAKGLADAQFERDPVERFSGSYASAVRAGAAVLAASGRPHRGRSRPTSVWTLLADAAPELGEWAMFFAAHSGLQAAAQAGMRDRISLRTADDMLRQAGQFTDLVERLVMRQQAA